MTRWKAVAPDGTKSAFEAANDGDACGKHDMFACALAGCPDAHGWTFTDLDTGRTIVPEEVEAATAAALTAQQKG
ncbi:hypothetical protein [Isoptericola hypogeus]